MKTMKTRQSRIFATLVTLFVLVSLFQNCAGSDFNIDEYTQANLASNGFLPPTDPEPQVIGKSGDLSVTAGQPASFSVSVVAGEAVTYRWFKNTVEIAGSSGASYMISATQASDAGTYAVIAQNSAGSVTTTFQLTVMATPPPPTSPAPVITTAPVANLYVVLGQNITLQVVASGSGLSYQWYMNGTMIAGASSSVFTRATTSTSQSGTYSVVVTNSSGSVTASSSVQVYVASGGGGAGGGGGGVPRNSNERER